MGGIPKKQKRKEVNSMKMVKVNTAVWADDIRKEISDWEEFAESHFCDDYEHKRSAENVIVDLRDMLETLNSTGGITQDQFEWFTTML